MKRYRINGRIYTAETAKDIRRLEVLAEQHRHRLEKLRASKRPERPFLATFRGKTRRSIRVWAIDRIQARVRLVGMGYNLASLKALQEYEV